MAKTKQFGIETLKKAAKFGIKLGTDVGGVLADGKIQAFEYPQILGDLMGAGDVIASGKDLINESKDLDDEETAELNAYIDQEFDIPNDQLENKIEKAIAAVAALYDLYLAFAPAAEVEGD